MAGGDGRFAVGRGEGVGCISGCSGMASVVGAEPVRRTTSVLDDMSMYERLGSRTCIRTRSCRILWCPRLRYAIAGCSISSLSYHIQGMFE